MKMLLVLCVGVVLSGCNDENVTPPTTFVQEEFAVACLDGVQYWTRVVQDKAYFAPRFNRSGRIMTCNN
jgi:hypothetical protein